MRMKRVYKAIDHESPWGPGRGLFWTWQGLSGHPGHPQAKEFCKEKWSGDISAPLSGLEVKERPQCCFLKNTNQVLSVPLFSEALNTSFTLYNKRLKARGWWTSLLQLAIMRREKRIINGHRNIVEEWPWEWDGDHQFSKGRVAQESKGPIKWFVVIGNIRPVMDKNEVNTRGIAIGALHRDVNCTCESRWDLVEFSRQREKC